MLLIGALIALPRAGAAQRARVPRIGILALGNPDPQPFLRAFKDGLLAQGYVEGEHVLLEVRLARGDASALADFAAELVRMNVELIVAYQTPAAQAAKQATTEISIVMAAVGDPVGTHLIASLARPGGNITGLSSASSEVAGKNVELLREMLPSARRVAVLGNANDTFTQPFLDETNSAAKMLGLEMKPFLVSPTEALDAHFNSMREQQVDAVIIQSSVLRQEATDLALRHRIPAFSPVGVGPSIGGLMAYSANPAEMFRQTATYVDRILRGAKPADLPVGQPTKFDLVINLKTAKSLGLTIPPTLLARADEVIE
jgi:putative ABC transport system substrate-binding protein